MLYKNTKAMVCLTDGDTEFFDIAAGVLQGDILVPYLFINLSRLRTTNTDRSNKKNGFILKKKTRSRRYPDTDNRDDKRFLQMH